MNKRCIIEDNRHGIPANYFSDISSLVNKISNKSLARLEKDGVFVFPGNLKESKDLKSDLFVMKSTDGNSYCTSNVMGFLGFKDQQLIIRSRFSKEKGVSGYDDYFIFYIFSKVLDLPNVVNLNTNADFQNVLFNFLVFLFPYYLKRALRKGPYKEYMTVRYNDYSVKGAIDLQKHITLNTPFVGKIACKRREFSYDNNLMELIRHTIEFIKRNRFADNLLFGVKDEIKLVNEVTLTYALSDRRKIIDNNKLHNVKHSYFREYSELQRLCLMILQQQNHSLGSGSQSVCGVLFDGSWFWEEYVNKVIKDYFYHPMNRNGIGCQWLFDKEDENNNGLIYPDFIGKNHKTRIIADAKYRPIKNIKREDYFQLLTYMFRFDAKIGYFLYPESSAEQNNEVYRLNQGISHFENNVSPRDDIKVVKIGFKVPDVVTDSYELFCQEMMRSEKSFINDLKLRDLNKL